MEAGIGPRALWGPWGLLKAVGGSHQDSPPRAPTQCVAHSFVKLKNLWTRGSYAFLYLSLSLPFFF